MSSSVVIRTNLVKPKTASEKKNKSLNIFDRIEDCERTNQYLLDVSTMELEVWPREVAILPAVRILKGFHNQLTCFPSLISFKYLEYLDLSRNSMTTMADSGIGQLVKLKHVDLSRNELESISEDITELPVLEVLILHRNKLTSLPSKLHRNKFLRCVDLSHNNLVRIGSCFDGLTHLEDLNLAHNPGLILEGMEARAVRLHEKRMLLASKEARRALITRALGIQRDVLTKEQQEIFREVHNSQRAGTLDPYP